MSADREIGELLASVDEDDRLLGLARLVSPEEEVAPHGSAVHACLRNRSEQEQYLAVIVLGRLRPPAIDALVEAVGKAQTLKVRMAAAAAIAGIGPEAAEAVPELCRCLAAEDENLRGVASVALGKVGSRAVEALRRMLQFSDPSAVTAAVNSLAMMGKDAMAAAGDLRTVAARGPLPLQLACAGAMAKITGDPGQGLVVLQQVMGSPDPDARRMAVEKAGELQAAAQGAVPQVIALVRDQHADVRAAACLALGRIGGAADHALPALVAALSDGEAKVRLNALIGISAFGKDVLRRKADIESCTEDSDEGVAAAAKKILENLAAV